MAGSAKVFRIGVARIGQLRRCHSLRLNMTINAVNKTMLLSAYTFVHGFIALVQNKIHVAAAHNLGRLNALISLRCRNGRQQRMLFIPIPFASHDRSGKETTAGNEQKNNGVLRFVGWCINQ